jgi:riboflavin kinase/FMN adenylyltransferase
MIVVRSLSEIQHERNSAVTVGTFDGVHVGHRAIIAEMVRCAKARNGRSVLITFHPHPRTVVGRGPVKQLTSLDERIDLIAQLGVDAVLVLDFTYAFSRLTSREFYERYVVKGIGVSEVVLGHDHMFGRDREAGTSDLHEMGIEFGFVAHVVGPVAIGGNDVSSSKIRESLLRGDVEQAQRFLSRTYSLTGIVVKGDGRGSQIGFPTANIQPSVEEKLVPAEGVYFVGVEMGSQQYFGMLNIGVRPTFQDDMRRVIEVHMFDFTGDLYGKSLKISFLKRLRSEIKFASREALIDQLERDRSTCMKLITSVQLS